MKLPPRKGPDIPVRSLLDRGHSKIVPGHSRNGDKNHHPALLVRSRSDNGKQNFSSHNAAVHKDYSNRDKADALCGRRARWCGPLCRG